ncbi:GNAT family N-acetyltransferase [Paeniroseomonas aquatica]|jgi:ribosomal protein S18 acetylase RimI-like enzyme|uniref:GNAT family N-acetyltransferase n=1 Tax=Paeniroseomonas aquatica TaxID=373043 RepID=A0ABT8A277_9PROT|nr:GNAT family N-acetyltransferase [Paeniroseomonas aquatica]MDN3563731.1 GNAT family N-acetyltransferase [Paeniroseomonas aquatica]
MICIRRARPADAAAIGAVHVATWRTAYAGVLPDGYLTSLSALRHAAGYETSIGDRRHGHAVFVAVAKGADAPAGTPPGEEEGTIIGFVSGGRSRRPGFADGEVETLYLLDDYRDRGIGRRLMRAMAAHLAVVGCRSVMLWVLKDNPTRWFYQRLGGRPMAREVIRFAGESMEQLAFAWNPIEALLTATAPASEA